MRDTPTGIQGQSKTPDGIGWRIPPAHAVAVVFAEAGAALTLLAAFAIEVLDRVSATPRASAPVDGAASGAGVDRWLLVASLAFVAVGWTMDASGRKARRPGDLPGQ